MFTTLSREQVASEKNMDRIKMDSTGSRKAREKPKIRSFSDSTHYRSWRPRPSRSIARVLDSSSAVLATSVRRSKVSVSSFDDYNEVEEFLFDDCTFPFENLVFEGGGNKGFAYVGSIEVRVTKFHIQYLISSEPKQETSKNLSLIHD